MYKRLHLDKVITTAEKLKLRLNERFPQAGLLRVADELLLIAHHSKERVAWIDKPNLSVRIAVAAVFGLAAVGGWFLFHSVHILVKQPSSSDVVQIVDAFLSSLVFLGGSIFFLLTIESRIKRKRALTALHELRAIAHVIDMHQLTKDPSMDRHADRKTQSSPERTLTGFRLQRYLDYCAEMLSLVGKLAAIYSQKLPDSEIVSAANELESLCALMSQKIWQKIQTVKEQESP